MSTLKLKNLRVVSHDDVVRIFFDNDHKGVAAVRAVKDAECLRPMTVVPKIGFLGNVPCPATFKNDIVVANPVTTAVFAASDVVFLVENMRDDVGLYLVIVDGDALDAILGKKMLGYGMDDKKYEQGKDQPKECRWIKVYFKQYHQNDADHKADH